MARLLESGNPNDLKIFKMLCKDCQKFVKKFKKWDDSKVARKTVNLKGRLITIHESHGRECGKCKSSYEIHNGMIFAIPLVMEEELNKPLRD